MANIAEVLVRITADTRNAQQGLDNTAKSAQGAGSKISGGLKKVAGVVAGAFAVKKVVDFGKEAVDAARAVNTQLSLTSNVFGDSASAIEAWSKTSVESMGLTQEQALTMANGFGTLGAAAGLTGKPLADFGKSMTERSNDIASFYKVKPEQVFKAMQAGLKGATRPLKQFGINVDSNVLKQRALKMGLINTTKQALTPAQKTLAMQQEIMAQSGKAAGKYQASVGKLGTQQRILKARMEEAKVAIGQALLPAVLRITNAFLKMFDALQPMMPAVIKIATLIGDVLAQAVEALLPVFRALAPVVLGVLSSIANALGPLMAQLSPVLTMLANIVAQTLAPVLKGLQPVFAAIVQVVGILLKSLTPVLAVIGQLAVIIGQVLGQALEQLAPLLPLIAEQFAAQIDAVRPLLPLVVLLAKAIGVVLVVALKLLVPVLTYTSKAMTKWYKLWGRVLAAVVKAVTTAVKWIISNFTKLPGMIGRALSKLFDTITKPFRTAFDWVTKNVPKLWNAFTNVVSKVAGFLTKLFTTITSPFSKAFTWVASNVSKLWNAFVNVATNVAGKLTQVTAKITAPFSKAYTWVRDNVTKLWTGLTQVAGKVAGALSGVGGKITAPFKSGYDWVRSAVSRLWSGLSQVGGKVSNALSGVGGKITAPFVSGYNWVKDNIGKLWSGLSSVASKITNALSGVVSALTSPFKSAWDWIKRNVIDKIGGAWNGVANAINSIRISFTVPSNIATRALHLAGKGYTFDPPNVPTIKLAQGGYFTQATNAVIGEAGAEWAVPDAKLRQLIREEAGGSGTTIVVNGALDPDAVARQIQRIMRGRERRVGGVQRSGTRTTGAVA